MEAVVAGARGLLRTYKQTPIQVTWEPLARHNSRDFEFTSSALKTYGRHSIPWCQPMCRDPLLCVGILSCGISPKMFGNVFQGGLTVRRLSLGFPYESAVPRIVRAESPHHSTGRSKRASL